MLVAIHPDHPEPRKIRRAVDALEAGDIIAYPTDSVYGLGCDLLNRKGIDALYAMKRMDRGHLLSFICSDLSEVAKYATIENQAYRVLRHFLPGPYCFILEATREVPKHIQSKRKTVGIRIPKSPVLIALVKELGRPLVSTSATDEDGEPMIDPDEIDDRYPGLALVLDGGAGGKEATTVVDLTGPMPIVVREGSGPVDAFLR